ncbi:MAG: hypothetical protein AAGA08_19280 [Pseudomonadota bacterium]
MSLREGEDWNELYDLGSDPIETTNLFDAQEADLVRQKMTEVMLRRMIALQDRSPLPAYRA